MKQSHKILIFTLFCCLSLVTLSGDAYAADVLETVRDKAAHFIKNLRPLIFILAGFGLIGFAFGAIFGKISWKWFANIAIGLFLVANVGLFIDYFASKSGAKGTYSEKLGYGKYLDASGSYTATPGSSSDPSSQKDPGAGGDGKTDNSTSDDMSDNCVPGTGTGCSSSGKESGSDAVVNTKEGCSAAGGLWTGTSCALPEEETPDEAPLPGTGFENVYDADGGMLNGVVVTAPDLSGNKQSNLGDLASKEGFNLPTIGSGSSSSSSTQSNLKVPSGEQMNDLAEKAKEQYNSTGKVDMNQLLRDEVAAGRMTEEQAAQAGAMFTEAANSKGGNVGAAIDDVLKESKEQMAEEKAAANNDMASSAGNIGNLYDQIINEETPDEEPLPGTGFEQQEAECRAQGGYWTNNTCMLIINEETPDEEALPGTGFEQQKAACRAQGGYWINNTCMPIINEETPDEEPLPGTGFEYDVDGGELDEVVVTGKDYSAEKRNCSLTGGTWNSSKMSCEYEELNSPIDVSNSNNGNKSNIPSHEQMNALAQRAKEQYDSSGKIDMNRLLREEIAAGRMTAEQAAWAGGIFTEVANSKGGNVGAAIDEVLKSSKQQMEEEKSSSNNSNSTVNIPVVSDKTGESQANTSGTTEEKEEGGGVSHYACLKLGGTWDDASGTCKGVSASTSSNDEDEEDAPIAVEDEEDDEDTGISHYACNKKGGQWINDKCVLPGK